MPSLRKAESPRIAFTTHAPRKTSHASMMRGPKTMIPRCRRSAIGTDDLPRACSAATRGPWAKAPFSMPGAGTGLIGEMVEDCRLFECRGGSDISEGMIEVRARSRASMTRSIAPQWVTGHCRCQPTISRAAVCAGVFTVGHVGPEGLDELIRVVRSGGIIVITVKDRLWDDGFKERVEELRASGTWDVLEETPSYVSMPGRADYRAKPGTRIADTLGVGKNIRVAVMRLPGQDRSALADGLSSRPASPCAFAARLQP